MLFEYAYCKYLEFATIKQKTQSVGAIKQKFGSHILPFFKGYDIYNITELDFVEWQKYIVKQNFSYNYNRGLHYVFSGFLEYCVLFLNLKCNIARKVGCFKRQNVKVEHDFYTLKEFKQFIKYFDNNIYKQFFIFMFFCGTRPGEAMALKFSDLSYCSVSINKTISEHSFDGVRVVNDPKTFSSFRDIYISKKLYKNLIELKKYYISKYNNDKFDYYVFGGIKPLAVTSVNRYKKNACLKANIRPIKLHEFRHSHASLLHSMNIPLLQIKDRLGHSDINITMGVYVHLTNRHKKRISKILNLLFFTIK